MPDRTTSPGTAAPVDSARLLDAVRTLAEARAGDWFPDLDGRRTTVAVQDVLVRPRCLLYRIRLEAAGEPRGLVVKVRHSDARLRRADRFEGDRPVLAPVRDLPDAATARCEFEGLALLQEALRPDAGSGRFGVLRPLALLPEHAALVTDLVESPTLRTALLRTTRLRLGRPGAALPDEPWVNAGAALRRFHDHPTSLPLEPRTATPASVGRAYQEFAAFLSDRVGRCAALDELSTAGVDLARDALPAELPLRTSHGDFVSNNVFADPDWRITVFDPLPMWQVPAYQDLATLSVGVRVLPLQASTRGRAFPAAALDRYERALVSGYFGADPVPERALAAFQLLVLLDRWSGHVSRAHRGGPRWSRRRARLWMTERHYSAEVTRALRRTTGTPVATPGEA